MEIEEWRPPPPSPLPPETTRKKRPALIVAVIMAGAFLLTLAFLNRHNLIAPAEQVPAVVGSTNPVQPGAIIQAMKAPPARELSAQLAQNINSIAECISGTASAAQDREQVIKILLAQAGNAEPAVLATFVSGSVDPKGVTTVQALGFMGMLSRLQAPLGNRAQQEFQQGIQEGICKIASLPVSQGQSLAPTS